MLSYTRTAPQAPVIFQVFVCAKIQTYKMKLVIYHFRPLITSVFTTSALRFSTSIYVSVKILYFYQVLEQKNTKQKRYAKSSVRSNADKARVDDSWENCVLHQ